MRKHLDAEGFQDVRITDLGGEPPARTDPDDPFIKLVVNTASDVYSEPMALVPGEINSKMASATSSGLRASPSPAVPALVTRPPTNIVVRGPQRWIAAPTTGAQTPLPSVSDASAAPVVARDQPVSSGIATSRSAIAKKIVAWNAIVSIPPATSTQP